MGCPGPSRSGQLRRLSRISPHLTSVPPQLRGSRVLSQDMAPFRPSDPQWEMVKWREEDETVEQAVVL